MINLRDRLNQSIKKLGVWLFAILFLGMTISTSPAIATGVYDLPLLGGNDSTWVIDEANAISRINEGKLDSVLKHLAQDTGKEVRMVVLRRLDYGETIDSFSDRLFETWFPTPEAQANEVLITLDILTNNAAIRTGEALQGVLNEEMAQSIIKGTIGVPIREGNKYNEALLSAGDRLAAILSGQPDPGAPEMEDTLNIERTFATAEETNDRSATIWVVVLLVLATVIPMATYFFYQGFSG